MKIGKPPLFTHCNAATAKELLANATTFNHQ